RRCRSGEQQAARAQVSGHSDLSLGNLPELKSIAPVGAAGKGHDPSRLGAGAPRASCKRSTEAMDGLRALPAPALATKKSCRPCGGSFRRANLAEEQFEHAPPRDRFGLGVRGDRDRLLARACGLTTERFSGLRSRLAARACQAWPRRGGRRRRAFRRWV